MGAGIAAAVGAAAQIGLGAANAAGAFAGSGPQQYSPAEIAAIQQAEINASLASYPELAALSAAAAGGLTTTAPGYTARTIYTDPTVTSYQAAVTALQKQLAATPQAIPNPGQKGANMLNPQWTVIQNQLNAANQSLAAAVQGAPNGGGPSTVYYDSQGNQVTPAQATVNFSGLSNADVNNANALSSAQGNLALEQQYGPATISEDLALEQLANPQGVAARNTEYQDITDQQNTPPDTTLATTLQGQLQDELNAGTNLTPAQQTQVTQAARQAEAARGNLMGNANAYSEAMTAGQAGINLQNQNQQKALAFLTSGATPTDINYRYHQQNIGNLASFLSGQTPQAQFGQLSGSGSGPISAAPAAGYSAAPVAANTATSAASNALGLAQLNNNAAYQQGNPWMQGLSSIVGGFNTLGANNGAGISSLANLFKSPTGSNAAFPGTSDQFPGVLSPNASGVGAAFDGGGLDVNPDPYTG
jgi:hypothetical protein